MSVAAVASTPIVTPATTPTTSASTTVAQAAPASSSSTSSTATSGGDGTGPVATQVVQWASIVADGSSASTAEKAAAYVAINAAITQGLTSGTNQYFAQATLAQRHSVANIIDNSSFAKQSYAAAQSFAAQQNSLNYQANAKGADVSPSNSMLARLNQLSSDQQQLVFAGLGGGFSSLADWKVQLQKDQDTMAADYAADNGGAASVTVSLSDSAKAALSTKGQSSSTTTSLQTSTDSSAKALQTLTSKAAGTSSADVGLAVLQSAAQAKATADSSSDLSATSSKTSTADTSDKPYQAGDRLSLTA